MVIHRYCDDILSTLLQVRDDYVYFISRSESRCVGDVGFEMSVHSREELGLQLCDGGGALFRQCEA